MTERDAACWVTGVGTANPLGNSYATTADNLLAGKSGVHSVLNIDMSRHPSQIAGLVGEVPVPAGCDADEFARLDGVEQILLWSCVQALHDAGLWQRRGERRVGLVLAIGSEWMGRWEADRLLGGNYVHDPSQDQEAVAARIRRTLGLTGPMATVAAACAGGNFALALGRRWLRMGWADVCLAGGADRGTAPVSMACFGNLGALSRRNGAPAAASRPFDRGRDGFVMGEGGAVFVLEPADHARARGVRTYAEFAGFGGSSDAFHMIIPSPHPEHAVAAMRAALADAAINPDEIDYVNAHATSTPIGDPAETRRVLQTLLGEAIRRVPVSATKSMTGHLLSGAAAVDALACLVALERQTVPPTINLDDPDPECNLCHVANQARPHPVRVAVSNSFGFGGSNSCIVLRKVA